jgi:hypothetical protein
VIVAFFWGWLQYRHNRKSVEPICSIRATNYTNFISIRIENNGIGPLKIDDIRFYNCKDPTNDNNNHKIEPCDEEISLFELLTNNISQTTYHRIWPGGLKTDGLKTENRYTVAVNDRFYLLSISPENDEIKRELRSVLKTIKICVKYTDSYKSYFVPKITNFALFSSNIEISITDPEKYHIWC